MPIPALDRLTPEFRELVETARESLFRLSTVELTREEAIAVKIRITGGLGVFNSRQGLESDSGWTVRRRMEAERRNTAS